MAQRSALREQVVELRTLVGLTASSPSASNEIIRRSLVAEAAAAAAVSCLMMWSLEEAPDRGSANRPALQRVTRSASRCRSAASAAAAVSSWLAAVASSSSESLTDGADR